MAARFAKVKEIAATYRVSADAVYLWIKQGKVPSDCVVRIGGTIRLDEEQFERRLRSGALCQPSGCKPPQPRQPETSLPTGDAPAPKPEAG